MVIEVNAAYGALHAFMCWGKTQCCGYNEKSPLSVNGDFNRVGLICEYVCYHFVGWVVLNVYFDKYACLV